jgi:hypothetical protein
MPNKNKSQADLDWENRTLCLDESCIGVIGPDGRCKECGKPYDGFVYQTADTEETDTPDVPAVSDERGSEATDPDLDDTDTDWENRTLCADESCIGVIGPDGRCKECGLPFKENG